MVVFQTAKLRRGVRMFRATRSTAGSRQIITILTTSSVFRAPGQPPTRSALLTPNWRGCEGTSYEKHGGGVQAKLRRLPAAQHIRGEWSGPAGVGSRAGDGIVIRRIPRL